MSTSVQTDCCTRTSAAEPMGAAHLRPNVDGPHMLRDKASCAAKRLVPYARESRRETSACDADASLKAASERCRRKWECVPAWVAVWVRVVCRLHSVESRRVRVPRHGVVPTRPTVVQMRERPKRSAGARRRSRCRKVRRGWARSMHPRSIPLAAKSKSGSHWQCRSAAPKTDGRPLVWCRSMYRMIEYAAVGEAMYGMVGSGRRAR